jgi:hypothetical protein
MKTKKLYKNNHQTHTQRKVSGRECWYIRHQNAQQSHITSINTAKSKENFKWSVKMGQHIQITFTEQLGTA